MRPSFWSKNLSEQNNIGWHYDGINMSYKISDKNDEITKINKKLKRTYYQFEFDYYFRSINDEIFCSLLVPYSYT